MKKGIKFTTIHLNQKDRQLNGQQLVTAIQSDEKFNSGLAALWYPYFRTQKYMQKKKVLFHRKKRRKGMPKIDERLKRGQATFRSPNNLSAIKWMDKKEVYMLSTMHTVEF